MNNATCPFDKILNIELFFAESESVKIKYPKYLPLLLKSSSNNANADSNS
jgi:hypothetical protein